MQIPARRASGPIHSRGCGSKVSGPRIDSACWRVSTSQSAKLASGNGVSVGVGEGGGVAVAVEVGGSGVADGEGVSVGVGGGVSVGGTSVGAGVAVGDGEAACGAQAISRTKTAIKPRESVIFI